MNRTLCKTLVAWAACLVVLAISNGSATFAQEPKTEKEKTAPPVKQKGPRGRQRFIAAYKISDKAKSIEDYTQIIKLCEQGFSETKVEEDVRYGKRLAAWAYYKRAESQRKSDSPKDKEALADYEAAVELDAEGSPGKPNQNYKVKYLHMRGVTNAFAGDFKKALADFSEVIRLQPGFENGKEYFNRGEIHSGLGDYQRAIADYDRALRHGHGESDVYRARGFAYFKLKDVNRAIRDYTAAVNRNGKDYEAYTYRGDAYFVNGVYANAIRDYQRAIGINDAYGRVYYSAAWFRATCPNARFRDGKLALSSARKAIELDGKERPDHYHYLDVLAAAQARAGEFEGAVTTQTEAVKITPPSETAKLKKGFKARLELYKKGMAYSSEEKPARSSRRTR